MPFLNLTLKNFRNLENSTIDLLSKEVYFVGENGQGKSNLLESIYMSSYGSSFRTNNDSEIIKTGNKDYFIKSFYQSENQKTTTISINYENSKKRIEKNSKVVKDRKELINSIPCVLFCHDDLDFSVGLPERRRYFIDQCLSMYDLMYIDTLRKYKHCLKIRNNLLKEQKYSLIETYDIPLAQEGLEIMKRRKKAISNFNILFSRLFEQVTGIDGVNIYYEPSWKSYEINDIFDTLIAKRDSDKAMCTTISGPHRDRIFFVKEGKPFIRTASTGQRRLTALILRIAQASYFTEITEKKPILLMDDVLLELDPDKRQKVTTLLPDYDQLFCTFLPGEPYERYQRSTTKIYKIEQGKWFNEKNR